ncbi:hypothetical protein MHPYR_440019 [uncultured Mycobacterium sp.]|uniref:Uncharacterized protein n=1 Tax=uncultured Mycobacterium sp. TaxID=171292 RepID=A0A1Y5PFK7_9MYCO|nr:hypothetical protein MHPYR_440019 [uncultured Mycobacterium sp.]
MPACLGIPRTDPGPGLIPSASGDRHLREITAPAAEVRSGYLRAGMIHLDGRIGLKHCCPSGCPIAAHRGEHGRCA